MAPPKQRVQKGQKAQAFLTDPVVTEAFDKIQADQISKFVTSKDADKDKREMAYWTLRALEALKDELYRFMHDGKRAAKELDSNA